MLGAPESLIAEVEKLLRGVEVDDGQEEVAVKIRVPTEAERVAAYADDRRSCFDAVLRPRLTADMMQMAYGGERRERSRSQWTSLGNWQPGRQNL